MDGFARRRALAEAQEVSCEFAGECFRSQCTLAPEGYLQNDRALVANVMLVKEPKSFGEAAAKAAEGWVVVFLPQKVCGMAVWTAVYGLTKVLDWSPTWSTYLDNKYICIFVDVYWSYLFVSFRGFRPERRPKSFDIRPSRRAVKRSPEQREWQRKVRAKQEIWFGLGIKNPWQKHFFMGRT